MRYLLPLGDGIGDVVLFGSVNYRGEVYGSGTTHPADEPGGPTPTMSTTCRPSGTASWDRASTRAPS